MAGKQTGKVAGGVDAAFGQVKRQLLDWESGVGRDDQTPVDELIRRHRGADASEKAALAEAMRRALTEPQPELRCGAIRFFSSAEDAPDGGALAAALRDRPELYTGVRDPWFAESQEDLRALLARAVAARVRPADKATMELVKREALTPGRATAVVAGLMYQDLAWVESHAAEIARRTPLVLKALLFNLQRRGRPVLPLVQALRQGFPRAELRAAVEEELKPEAKAQALAALDAAPLS